VKIALSQGRGALGKTVGKATGNSHRLKHDEQTQAAERVQQLSKREKKGREECGGLEEQR